MARSSPSAGGRARSSGTAGRSLTIAEAIGTANVDWEYLRVQFSFNLEDVARQSDQQLEYVYLHEVAHHLVNEMRENDPTGKHEERVVSTIAKVILRARYAK